MGPPKNRQATNRPTQEVSTQRLQCNALDYKHVVTSFLTVDQQILLLRRSEKVGTHRHRWSAVSGHLENNEAPLKRALTEIREEVGLQEEQLTLIRPGEALRAYDKENDTVWIVHPFLFQTKSKAIQLDWENTAYAWINPKDISSYETVPKLKEVYDRVRRDLNATPQYLTPSLRAIDDVANDRIHGASFLGRRAVELLSTTSTTSKAQDQDELFSDLLMVGLRLRKAQPAMAIVWNLVGQFLELVDRERKDNGSLAEFKNSCTDIAGAVLQTAIEAAEDASRNAARLLPQTGHILTHSYSSIVQRSIELGVKGWKNLEVYATESYPGMEGKEFAKALVGLGVPVKLIPDASVDSIISNVDVVIVGADSVLRDGSLIHKTGTNHIATTAHKSGIPFHSTCETLKFSARDFLGETPEFNKSLFDLTPPEHISSFTTEIGKLEPGRINERLKEFVKKIYP